MKKPEFFLVGAPKGGTTSMTRYLRRHPDIFIPDDIDPHFFSEDITYDDVFEDVTTENEYLSRFEPAAEDQVLGDTSTMNLYSETAADNIHQFNPDAKIIVMFRNPIDMMYSLHSHYLFGGNEDEEDFEEALRKEKERKKGRSIPSNARFPEGLYYREIADYSSQLERYFDNFPREQIEIILFEDFTEKTELIYREVLSFLEVDTSFKPEFKQHNPNKNIRYRSLHRFVRNPPENIQRILRFLDDYLPVWMFRKSLDKLYRWINTVARDREEMDSALRAELERELAESIRSLSEMIDRDLSHWVDHISLSDE